MKTNKVMIKLAEVHCVAHEKNPIFEKNRFLKKMFKDIQLVSSKNVSPYGSAVWPAIANIYIYIYMSEENYIY